MNPPPRCLHIVETLDRGAVENWLLRMLRHARETAVPVDWTFYCVLGTPGRLDDLARELGATVIHSPEPIGSTTAFVRSLRAELIRGRYDVVHAHHDLLNAVYFAASLRTPVKRRISHVHNADESVPTPSAMKRMAYREPLRQLSIRFADKVVGISNHTLDTFLNGRLRRRGRDVVHYYGVDPAPFADLPGDSTWFRRAQDIPDGAPILLFAGRMVPEKNPLFTIDVLGELRRILPDAVGVFAGAGPEEQRVTARAKDLGIDRHIRLLGWRNDLPAVLSAGDCFILPRPDWPLEGFGLAIVEAQLAGLPLLLSAGVGDDPLLPTALFRRHPLSAGARVWAQSAAEMMRLNRPRRDVVIGSLNASPMEMGFALQQLLELHQV